MQRYFFILGANPTLSVSELFSVFKKWKIDHTITDFSSEVLIVSSENTLDASVVVKTCGGVVKFGQILDAVTLDESEDRFYEIFSTNNIINRYIPNVGGKLHIGISIYNAGGENNYLGLLSKQLKDLNKTVKNNLQQEGKKVGFVQIKDRYLSSVSVFKNQLLSHGTEIVLILTANNIFVGKTLSVQEFEQFSFRDYGRPARDKRSGIMPPKLARMMINLAEVNIDEILLDPFCGSGTILQEAILLGYKNIIGTDISNKAISDTKTNIDWLFAHFHTLVKSSYNIRLNVADVKNISKFISSNTVDAIVTEPYLGPPLFRKPDEFVIKNILSEVSNLYFAAFLQFSKILKPGGTIIIIFPAFEANGKFYFVEILDKIMKLGFSQQELVQANLRENTPFPLTNRNTIIYGDRQQFAKREILSFVKL